MKKRNGLKIDIERSDVLYGPFLSKLIKNTYDFNII